MYEYMRKVLRYCRSMGIMNEAIRQGVFRSECVTRSVSATVFECVYVCVRPYVGVHVSV